LICLSAHASIALVNGRVLLEKQKASLLEVLMGQRPVWKYPQYSWRQAASWLPWHACSYPVLLSGTSGQLGRRKARTGTRGKANTAGPNIQQREQKASLLGGAGFAEAGVDSWGPTTPLASSCELVPTVWVVSVCCWVLGISWRAATNSVLARAGVNV
jgi:hypothetical protein